MAKPDPKLVQEFFNYCPEIGELRWRIGSRRRSAGELAGTAVEKEKGRRVVGFMGKTYKAHILIWVCQTGAWPVDQIDHINENPSDNRWCNLRAATKAQNMRNINITKANSSGSKGVGFHKQSGRWRAYIGVDGKLIHLGLFKTKEEAVKVRCDFSKKLHGLFSKG